MVTKTMSFRYSHHNLKCLGLVIVTARNFLSYGMLRMRLCCCYRFMTLYRRLLRLMVG
jgi:hypothetical protein